MTIVITRRPVSPDMVLRAAEALWEDNRTNEGRVPWDEAVSWARRPYENKAQLVLETALAQDDPDFLHEFGQECINTASILR